MDKRKGFTILELLVVVAIIAIIAVIAIPNYSGAVDKAKASRELAEAETVQKAVTMYYMDYGHYPASTQPAEGSPQSLVLSALMPDYLASMPNASSWTLDYQGKVSHGTAAASATTSTTSIELSPNLVLKFIPSTTATYTIETSNVVQQGPYTTDTYGAIFESDGTIILDGVNGGAGYDTPEGVSYQDGGGVGDNFSFTCQLTAGQLYYVTINDFACTPAPYSTCNLRITGGGFDSLPAIAITNPIY